MILENNFKWTLNEVLPEDSELNSGKYSQIIAQLLYNRGIRTIKDAEMFLSDDKGETYDASLLPNIYQAASRIYSSMMMGDRIAVYGDFDVDGITSTAIMSKGLTGLGADVITYIPHRGEEGHGLNKNAIESLIEKNVRLIVTVDCGISSNDEIKQFKKKVDFIVCDHHLPTSDILPEAIAIVDPYLKDSTYPFIDLAGCAVAFKLLTMVYRMIGRENEVWQFIDLVALGTVSDVMPLLGENRYLVNRGLLQLRTCKRHGINEIMRLSKVEKESLDVEGISWYIAPRLNAAGRLDHANKAFELLTTDDLDTAVKRALELDELNKERQKLTTAFSTIANDQIKDTVENEYIIITGNEEFTSGIVGLVAGKLCERYRLPALIMYYDGEEAHGSARSIPEFDVTEALTTCSDILIQYGGHSQAAGFSLNKKNIPEFIDRMKALAKTKLAAEELKPTLNIDAIVDLKDVDLKLFDTISTLAPFGECNHSPLFLSMNVTPREAHTMGTGEKHLRFKGVQGSTIREFVGWGRGCDIECIKQPLDIVYTVEINEWKGTKTINLFIKDMATHQEL